MREIGSSSIHSANTIIWTRRDHQADTSITRQELRRAAASVAIFFALIVGIAVASVHPSATVASPDHASYIVTPTP